jgi:hypothetical protein
VAYRSIMNDEERAVLVRAIHRVTEQAANADTIADEAMGAGLNGSDPVAKQLRAELLAVKADLERELERVVRGFVSPVFVVRLHFGNERGAPFGETPSDVVLLRRGDGI